MPTKSASTKSASTLRSGAPARQAGRKGGLSEAAEKAVDGNVTKLSLPLVGRVTLPPVDHMVWYLGVGVLTGAELIEWPVALALAVGKALADNRTHRTVQSFGEALEDAG